jgi:hypothetical protein
VVAFIAATVAAGLAVLAVAAAGFSDDRLGPVAVLAAFAVACELFDIKLFSQSRVSVSVAAILAAGMIAGLEGASIVALAAVAGDYAGHRKPFYKVLFNAAALVLSGAVYVGVFEHFPVGNDSTDWPRLLFPAVAGVIANFVVNSTLVGCAISLSSGLSFRKIFEENYIGLLPFYTVLGVLAAIVASAYESDGVTAMLIALAPVAMMRFIMKQAIERPPVMQPATA